MRSFRTWAKDHKAGYTLVSPEYRVCEALGQEAMYWARNSSITLDRLVKHAVHRYWGAEEVRALVRLWREYEVHTGRDPEPEPPWTQGEDGGARMVTYRNWLADQEGRDDRVGWYARYWKKVTPGRISAPQGIEKHLRELLDGISARIDANGGSTEAEDQELRQAQAALEIHAEAVEEYHKRDAAPPQQSLTLVPPLAPQDPLQASVDRHPANGQYGPQGGMVQASEGAQPADAVPLQAQGMITNFPGGYQVRDADGSLVDVVPQIRRGDDGQFGLASQSLPLVLASPVPVVPAKPEGTQLDRIEAKIDKLNDLVMVLLEHFGIPGVDFGDKPMDPARIEAMLARRRPEGSVLMQAVAGELRNLKADQMARMRDWAAGLDWATIYGMADVTAEPA